MNLKKILSCLFLVSAHGFNLNRRNLIRFSAPLLKINNYKDDDNENILRRENKMISRKDVITEKLMREYIRNKKIGRAHV